MIKGSTFSVIDYSSLASIVSAKDPSDSNSHLLTSFLCWNAPIQAALDACYDAGGGTVIIPKNTVPYYLNDTIYVKDNTTLICEDWLILADYTSTGGTFGATGDNILVQNLQIDNSNIYAGGSGQNGIGVHGKSIKFYGGEIKNCAKGVGGPEDGGKGIQIEAGNGQNIVVDGMTLTNCFMAMSTIRDYSVTEPYSGIIYNNISAYDCLIFFFVKQSNGTQVQTGMQHTVQLNNFYAKDCGAYDGVFQLSRASNVIASNGIVVNDPALVGTSLIRGNHANCQFVNIGFYGDALSVVQVDPSTYAIDSSQPNRNNRYDIQTWGQIDTLFSSNVTTPYRTLDNCFGSIQCRFDPTTAWFGNEMRNGTSSFSLTQNNKITYAATSLNYYGNGGGRPVKFSDLPSTSITAQLNSISFGNANSTNPRALDWYEENTWTPTFEADTGSGAVYVSEGSYTRIGNVVTITARIAPSSFGTLANRIIIGGLPFNNVSTPAKMGSVGITHATLPSACNISSSIGILSNNSVSFYWTNNAGGANDFVKIADVVAGSSVFFFTLTYFVA